MATTAEVLFPMVIGGQEVVYGSSSHVIDPSTGAPCGVSVTSSTKLHVDSAVAAAKAALPAWSSMAPMERSYAMVKLADLLDAEKDKLVSLEQQCTGKPTKLVANGDIPFGIDNLRYFAGIVRHQEGIPCNEYMGGYTSFTRREPVGVVAAIAPWNYPFMMAIWKCAPAIAAGCTVIIKPAPNTALTTVEFARIALKAGIPAGVINVVLGGADVGEALCTHPDVNMVTFTGSTRTGARIAEVSSPLIKRLTLELGGKAPLVVFPDAHIDAAVQGAVIGAIQNSGQDCTAATRLIIHEKVYDEFLNKLIASFKQVKIGNPKAPDTDLGPLISEEHRKKVHGMVVEAQQQGAKIALGGTLPTGKGFFYPITVITDVTSTMKCVQEEIFGPVVVVMKFSGEDEGITMANDTRYGLAASVWTSSVQRAMKASKEIKAGTVWINDHLPLVSELPHGGFKASGIGKDMAHYSLEEFTVVKHVMIELTNAAVKPWHSLVFTPKN